jgi:radical SAM protein with 4Fe4S-binding SPASM domain
LRPGTSDVALEQFIPSKQEVARVYKKYKEIWQMDNPPLNCVDKRYCSTTIAVLYDGKVTPCATIRDLNIPGLTSGQRFLEIVERYRDELIFKKFKVKGNLPEDCQHCTLNADCWGCRSRAYAAGLGVYGKDPRCFRGRK